MENIFILFIPSIVDSPLFQVYPHIVRFPYPHHISYPAHLLPAPGPALLVTDQPAPAPATTPTTTPPVELEEAEHSTEFPIVSLIPNKNLSFKKIVPKRKIRKVKKSLTLIPNPQYAAEEFTYLPDPEDDINEVDDDDDRAKFTVPIGVNKTTISPAFIDNFENLRNINFRLTQDQDQDTATADSQHEAVSVDVESNLVEFVRPDPFR